MPVINCHTCGKEKKIKLSQVKEKNYCCTECYYNYKRSISKPKIKKIRISKLKAFICKRCKVEFKSYHKNRVYCSKKCLNKSLEKEKIILTCGFCKKDYEEYPSKLKVIKKRNHKITFCNKKCMNKYFVKENAPNWIEDRSLLKERRPRSTYEYTKWRKEVFKRDNYTCQWCKIRGIELSAHHIKKFSLHEDLRTEISNGITLCDPCHKKTYGKEKEYEELFKKMLEK